MPFLLDALPGWVAILRRMRDAPVPDGEGARGAYDADAILAQMRDDDESDWPHRLIGRIAVAPLVDEGSLRSRYVRRGPDDLSARELEVLSCASYGMEATDIAELLGLSHETVKCHLRSVRRRLRAKNTCHACCLAIRAGIIV